jgi:hypothetical protein
LMVTELSLSSWPVHTNSPEIGPLYAGLAGTVAGASAGGAGRGGGADGA